MNNRDKIIEKILSSNNTNLSSADLEKAANGELDSIMSKMKKEDSEKLKAVLEDPEKTKQLLSSDAAQQLMGLLFGKSKNG